MKNLLLAVLALFVTAIWGWTFPAVKDAVANYGVVSFLAIRFAMATAALGLFAAKRTTVAALRTVVILGAVLAGGFLLQTFGLRHTSVTNSGLITGLFVVFAPIANRLLYGIRTRRIFWAVAGGSLLGLVLLTGAGPEPLSVGDLLTLLGAAAYGVHIAMLGRHAKEHDAMGLALGQLIAATVLLTSVAVATEPLAWPQASVWPALLVTGLLATAASYPIQTYVQQHLPPVRTAIIFTMEPVFATFFGHILTGDRLTVIQWVGAVTMIGSVLIAEVAAAVCDRRTEAKLRDADLEASRLRSQDVEEVCPALASGDP